MHEQLGRALDLVTAFKADELIGALIGGLILALASAGIFQLARHRWADSNMLVTLTSFGCSVASMIGVTLYLGLVETAGDYGTESVASRVFQVGPHSPLREPPPNNAPVSYGEGYPGIPPWMVTPPITKASEAMRTVDEDQNRRLSPEEAATFVELVSRREDRTVGLGELAWTLHLAAAGLRPGNQAPSNGPESVDPAPGAGNESNPMDTSGDVGGFARTD